MTRILALALSSGLLLTGAAAFAADQPAPETVTALTTQLTDQGYEVRSIGMEDGMIEAYAVKDGEMFELYFDADLNPVARGDTPDDEDASN
ncbi:PepSY domain-containing protein [Pseudoroseicyclus sp. H15]